MATSRGRGAALAREERTLATVAYRGSELDELIAASSTQPAMTPAELTEYLESQDTVAQREEMISASDLEELVPYSVRETYEVQEEPETQEAADEPVPPSVPVVESTVVIVGPVDRNEPSVPSVHVSAFDSQRPVAYDIHPSSPSFLALAPPTAYTLESGVQSVVQRSSGRAPALITLTIAVVAITVGVLLGTSFSQALNGRSSANQLPVPAAVKAPEPHTVSADHIGLAGAGAVREKYVRPVKPIGMAFRRPASSGPTSEADFTDKLEKAQKAAKPDLNALNEALLNRPF